MTKRNVAGLAAWNLYRHVVAKHNSAYVTHCRVCDAHYYVLHDEGAIRGNEDVIDYVNFIVRYFGKR